MIAEAQTLYDLIKESFLLLDFGDRRLLEPYHLTVSRYYALHHIAAVPGLSPGHLSRMMFCDKSNITRLLQGLEGDSYVERRPHEQDGRAQRLYLTAAGTRLYTAVAAAHAGSIARRLASLPPTDVTRTIDSLARLNRSLSAALDD